MKKIVCLAAFVLCVASMANAQQWDAGKKRIVWNLDGHREPRIDLTLFATSINIGGYQEFGLRIKNNFPPELFVKVKVEVTDICGNTKPQTVTMTLKSYESKGGGTWSGGNEQWGFMTDCKESREIVKGERTRIASIRFDIVEVRDLDAEKKAEADKRAAAEKKLADERKLAADKKLAEEKKAAEEKKVAEEKKAAADKKAAEEKKVATDKKAAEEKKASEAKTASGSKTAAAGKEGEKSAATGGTSDQQSKTAAAEKSKATLQEDAEAARQAAIDKRNAEREAEAARQKAEEQRLQQKQAAYDSWKADKQKEQAQVDAASMAASFGVLTLVGGWIYNDKMGEVDPFFVYKGYKKKPAFHLGIDWGYSASSFPVIFKSDISTMRNGREVSIKELEKKAPFVINLEANVKMGLDHDNYGGYAYLNPKFGFSPIFDAFQFAPLLYGARVYGGAKWVKAYVEYGGGSRTWTQTSNDVEENGSAKSDMTFSKIGYGVRFTTNPDDDYRRSHISIGLIDEKLHAGGIGYFTDPVSNNIMKTGKSTSLTGYAFEWKKDHHFNLYCNLYPEYSYSGEIEYNAGNPSSSFKSSPGGGMFIEFGFLRSVDWW